MRKSLKFRLLTMFVLLFIPFLVVTAKSFVSFNSMSNDGVAINLAGSQRMRTM